MTLTTATGALLYVRSGRCVRQLLRPAGPRALMGAPEVGTLDPRAADVGAQILGMLEQARTLGLVTREEGIEGTRRLEGILGMPAGTGDDLRSWVVVEVHRDDDFWLRAEMPARRPIDRRMLWERLDRDSSADLVTAAFRRLVAKGEQYLADHGYGDAERTFPEESR